MRVETFAISSPGSRAHQDDAFADAELIGGRCVVVADGAGGHHGGSVASRLVTDTVLLNLANHQAWGEEALLGAITAASRSVHRQQDASEALCEMSSTVVILCLDNDATTAYWTHVGDSRLLHFHGGVGQILTKDHSVLQSFVDAGVALPGGRHPDRSLLYAAIGAEGDMRPVVGAKRSLASGDAFLLCTDGVWDALPLPDIEALLRGSGTVRDWVEAIAAKVKSADKPSQDNYTAVGVWIGDAGGNSTSTGA